MLGLNSALDQIINFPIETEEDNKSSAHEFVMLNDSLVIVSAPPTIKDNYDPNNTPEPNNDSKLVAGTSASVISTYVKVRTLRDEWEDLIQLLKNTMI